MQTLGINAPLTDYLADGDITTALELLYLTQKGVPAHLINVTTHEGIVMLTGITDNLLARERAEDIALALRGVRGVVNEVLISTPAVPDAELQASVTSALATDPATSFYGVHVAAAEGVVTLTGTVQTWAEKELVLRVGRGVRGVRRLVADQLTISWDNLQNSDHEITSQIRESLAWDIRVNAALVDVRTHDRTVYLSGTVGTATELAQVETTAYQAGATHVDIRDLNVQYWATNRDLRGDKYAPRPDEAIAEAVRAAFRCDPRVLAYQPLIMVHNGIVTLSGTVSNLLAKQHAERDARHVVGVADVLNLLKVRTSWFIPDLYIGHTIRAALARDPYVGQDEFSVYVRNGKAQLYGQVSSYFEQDQAGRVAAGVKGVTEVDNWVTIPGSLHFDAYQTYSWKPGLARPNPDFALAERIRSRLFWSPSLHRQAIEVAVKKGRATLTGTVESWFDRDQAGGAAYAAGAWDVRNDLVVDLDAGELYE
ncbi:BON domain-containing protein [Hymenobacter psoromatis]|uniref:BON domain-containing protein n=1 Tax=Hymenobacter psoromatis TaxID=1484116 RepID=UPI001CBF65C0|nr:BON domain-containing protein [Hymenobacter psoromatis]